MTAFFIFSIPFSKRSQLNFDVEQSRQKTNVQGNVPSIINDSSNESFFISFIAFLNAAKISSTSLIVFVFMKQNHDNLDQNQVSNSKVFQDILLLSELMELIYPYSS